MNLLPKSILNLLEFLLEKGCEVLIEDRDSSDSWVWDGNSICRTKWDGIDLKQDEILHEIGHWLVAEPEAREFPEYGLIPGIVDSYAWGTPQDGFRLKNGKLDTKAIYDYEYGLFSISENNIQEIATQKVSIYLGRKFGIKVSMPGLKNIHTWDQYEQYKKDEWGDFDSELVILAENQFQKVLKFLS